MFLQISTTNRCVLACHFCFGQYPRVVQDMSLKDFKKAFQFYSRSVPRISNVDLTPIVGEFFIKDRLKELKFLEERKKVENYDVVTNLIKMTDSQINHILSSKKTRLYVSIYGHDFDSFKATTGTDRYLKFEERLGRLYSYIIQKDEIPNITFIMRYAKLNEIPITSKVFKIIKGLTITKPNKIDMDDHAAHNNYTWAGQLKVPNPFPIPKKKGICLHSIVQTCVCPDQKITLCGLVDFKQQMVIGNTDMNIWDVYGPDSYYRDLIEKQNMGIFPKLCHSCNEYEYYLDEPQQVERHLNKIRFLRWI